MTKENNIEEVTIKLEHAKGYLYHEGDETTSNLISKALEIIEFQNTEIELLKQNNDLKDEIITNARKAYKELSEKVDKVLNEIGTL